MADGEALSVVEALRVVDVQGRPRMVRWALTTSLVLNPPPYNIISLF